MSPLVAARWGDTPAWTPTSRHRHALGMHSTIWVWASCYSRPAQSSGYAASQAPLAVLLPRPRRQGDDGQVASRRSLALPDLPDDLEAVQLWHVDVQEQQVEGLAL